MKEIKNKVFYFIRRNKKIIFKIGLVFIIPIIFNLWIYPFKEKIILHSNESLEFKISELDLFKKTPSGSFVKEIFSADTLLDWYKVSIVNNSTEVDPNCLDSKKEKPVVEFDFTKGDPRKYGTNLKDEYVDQGFGYSISKYPNYFIRGGDKYFFIAPSWEEYIIDGSFMMSGDCKNTSQGDFKMITLKPDYYISIKPYWMSWFSKLIIVIILWNGLIHSVISLYKWIKK